MKSFTSKFRISVVLIAVFLSVSMLLLEGCGSSRSSEFVGTWQGETQVQDNDGFTYNQSWALAVSKDGNFEMAYQTTGRWVGTDYGSGTFAGTWDSSSNKLTLNRTDQAVKLVFLLSKDGTTLSDQNGDLVLYRVNS